MGLFDKLSSSNNVKLTPKGALALAALTIIGVDGAVEDEEISGLRRIVRGDERALQSAYQIYKDKDVDKCVSLVGSVLNDRQKVAVIANLLDLAMADGMLAGSEKYLLEAYIEDFGIDEDIISSIIDFIVIKNDFSIFDS